MKVTCIQYTKHLLPVKFWVCHCLSSWPLAVVSLVWRHLWAWPGRCVCGWADGLCLLHHSHWFQAEGLYLTSVLLWGRAILGYDHVAATGLWPVMMSELVCFNRFLTKYSSSDIPIAAYIFVCTVYTKLSSVDSNGIYCMHSVLHNWYTHLMEVQRYGNNARKKKQSLEQD